MARALPLPRPENELSIARADDFGFDVEFTERMRPAAAWVFRHYFRVETSGVTNVPATGRALLVSNHAGVVPWDGAMIRTSILLEHPQPRHARMLVLDWAFAMPFLSVFMTRTGNVLAHPDNATRLLERDELVGVFPEGVKGASKPFTDRYQVRRFGRGGFVQIALRTGAPIVPVAVVGSEETHPVLADIQPLARLLGLPSIPITPTFPWLGPLGMLPLPSKWFIEYGRPIDTRSLGPEAAEDPSLVLEITEEIRSWIQTRIREMLPRRRTAFTT